MSTIQLKNGVRVTTWGRVGEMVGKQHRVAGVVADVSDRSGAGARSGERRYLRGSELDVQQLAAGTIESLNTRCYPPPKHKNNESTQAHDISGQSAERRAERSSVSARPSESTSA